MKPTKILSDEHQNILKVADALNRECDSSEGSKRLDEKFFKNAIDFIRNYADKFHHQKEEDILFKELCKDSVQMHCNPVEQMLHEHNLGRNFVKGIEEGLKNKSREKILENARGYVQLIQQHIFKEDNILYPMADEALNQKVQGLIFKKFKKVEKINKDRNRCLSILKEFENRK